jgi:hypothetical protein
MLLCRIEGEIEAPETAAEPETLLLRELECVMFPRGCKRKSTVMLVAYLDESDDGKQEKIFAVGAFMGRNERWASLEWKWQRLLKEYGIRYYHAVEAENLIGEFGRPPFRSTPGKITPPESKAIKDIRKRFLELACNGTLAGIVLGVDMAEFRAVANTPELLDKFGGTPFYYGYHIAMLTAVDLIKYHLRSKELVAFVCDQQQEFSGHMLKVHSDFQNKNVDLRSQIGSLTYANKIDFVGLQAADCLVYEGRRCLQAQIDNPGAEEREALRLFKNSHSIARIDLCQRLCLEEHLKTHRHSSI